MRAIFDAIINDDPLPEEKNADNTPVPGDTRVDDEQTPESTSEHRRRAPAPDAGEVVDAVTTDPHDSDRAGVELDGPGRPGGHRRHRTAAARLQRRHPRRLSRVRCPRRRCSSRRATKRPPPRSHRRSPTRPSSGSPGWATSCRWCSARDFNSVSPPSPSGSSVQVHVLHGTSSTPTQLPEDLTVTNAADTTCE